MKIHFNFKKEKKGCLTGTMSWLIYYTFGTPKHSLKMFQRDMHRQSENETECIKNKDKCAVDGVLIN